MEVAPKRLACDYAIRKLLARTTSFVNFDHELAVFADMASIHSAGIKWQRNISILVHCNETASAAKLFCISQRALTIFELCSEFAPTPESEQGMSKGVVPDHMSGFHQFANNVGTLLHVTSDEEKCGVNIVPGQDIQQALSMRIVGTVVISERQLLRP